jgi:hypothetical protein
VQKPRYATGKVEPGGVLWDVIYVEEIPFWFAGRGCPVLLLNRYCADQFIRGTQPLRGFTSGPHFSGKTRKNGLCSD